MRRLVPILLAVAALCAVPLPVAAGAATAPLETLELQEGFEVQALAAGPHGTLWAAGVDGTTAPPRNFLVQMSPGAEPKAYVDPGSVGEAGIGELIRGPEGWMWFTVPGAEEIDRIDIVGTLRRRVQPAGSRPTGLAVAQGSVWATLEGVPEIKQIEPGPPPIWSEWGLPIGTSLTRMVLGSDNHLWALQADSGTVVRESLQGASAPVRLGTGEASFAGTVNSDIAAGDDGNIWVSQRDRRTVGKLVPDPDGNGVDYVRYAVAGGPTTLLAPGPGGDIWFADEAGMIGSISTDGKLGEPLCAVQACANGVTALARGPEGGLWVAAGDTVERFTPPPLELEAKSVDGKVRKGRIDLQVRCMGGAGGQSCRGRVELFHGDTSLEQTPYRAVTGSVKELSLPLSRTTRKLLATRGWVRVRVVFSVAGRATSHHDFTLRAG